MIIMANRNVHVFDNFFDGNDTAQVMVIAYTRPFEDDEYNPLPRDIVIRDNVYGNGGHAAAFEGGKQLAAAMGGTIPPILWDGATSVDGRRRWWRCPCASSSTRPHHLGHRQGGHDRRSGTIGLAIGRWRSDIAEPKPFSCRPTSPG